MIREYLASIGRKGWQSPCLEVRQSDALHYALTGGLIQRSGVGRLHRALRHCR
jgi:hypothetical protein